MLTKMRGHFMLAVTTTHSKASIIPHFPRSGNRYVDERQPVAFVEADGPTGWITAPASAYYPDLPDR